MLLHGVETAQNFVRKDVVQSLFFAMNPDEERLQPDASAGSKDPPLARHCQSKNKDLVLKQEQLCSLDRNISVLGSQRTYI